MTSPSRWTVLVIAMLVFHDARVGQAQNLLERILTRENIETGISIGAIARGEYLNQRTSQDIQSINRRLDSLSDAVENVSQFAAALDQYDRKLVKDLNQVLRNMNSDIAMLRRAVGQEELQKQVANNLAAFKKQAAEDMEHQLSQFRTSLGALTRSKLASLDARLAEIQIEESEAKRRYAEISSHVSRVDRSVTENRRYWEILVKLYRLLELPDRDLTVGAGVQTQADVDFSRGLTSLRLLKYQDALVEFQRAIRQDPDNAAYHYGLAMLYHTQRKAEQAEDTLKHATDLEQRRPIVNWPKVMERIQGPTRIWMEESRRAATEQTQAG